MHGSILAITPLPLPNLLLLCSIHHPGTGRMLKRIPTPGSEEADLSQGMAREGER